MANLCFVKNAGFNMLCLVILIFGIIVVVTENPGLVFCAWCRFLLPRIFYCVRIQKGDIPMTDYKGLYYQLFNKITDVIEDLKEAQKQAEEMYMNSGQDDSSKECND